MKRLLIALLTVSTGLAVAQLVPADLDSDEAPTPEATGTIAGIVVSAKTGEPLRSARVSLQASGPRDRGGGANPMAFSGIDGRFVFSDLPPGEYGFFCSKTGYGARQRFDMEARVTLGAGETREDVTLRLQPSAVVSGRVLDAYGQPLPGANVSVMSRQYWSGETRWSSIQDNQTNDLGEYRIYGLSPGKYVIAVRPPREISPRGVSFHEFSTAYYPNAESPEQATRIKLSWGDELTGIDFRLEPAPENAIQGIVVDGSTGVPCDRCDVRLWYESDLQGPGSLTTREGIFVLRGVQAGLADVVARYPPGPERRVGGEQVVIPESGAVRVSLTVGRGQTVSGEVVLEDPPEQEDDAPQGDPRRRRPQGVSIMLMGRRPTSWGRPPRANAPLEGGPVEFQDVAPGSYWVQVRVPNGGYLRAISIDGRVNEQPDINVAPDVPLSGVKFHIAFDGASLEGVVKPPPGQETSPRAAVHLVPEPGSSPYAERETIYFQGETFQRSGIFPARYSLYALPRLNTLDLDDPEVLRELAPYAKKVTFEKGKTVTVELTAVPDSL